MAAVALASVAPAAEACGVCVEDKVATAYDHAVVSSALARRRVVVFAEVSGASSEAAGRAAAGVNGIDRSSVRSAVSPAVVSFALDPGVRGPESALAAVQARAGPSARMTLLKILKTAPAP
jgi:hypothetical protein